MEKKTSSYNQILKSTSIFGGSQIVTILLGIVRTKIVAILLGPAGLGIIGVFQSIIDLMRSGYGFGIDTAAVRDVAAANIENDGDKLNKTVSLFNKLFYLSAFVGAIGCIVFCYPISIWAFGESTYSIHIALLSLAVFFTILTVGRSSILQGMRRIGDMAKSSIIGSVLSLLITIPLYYFWKIDGIIPYFILINILTFICANIYYKRLHFKTTYISYKAACKIGTNVLKFGFYVVVAGLIGTFTMFLLRGLIIKNIDLDAAGLFQSAWTITSVYLALILRSMGSDFFPRLSAIADDNKLVKGLVNEQSYITLLIASPIIVGMILFSDVAISILYSSKFSHAGSLLQWQLVGTFLKVLSWPIAFIMLAKNKGLLFLITEILFYGVYILICHFMIDTYGLDITGIGYLIAYMVYLPSVFIAGKYISGFGWRKDIVTMIIINAILIASSFYISMNEIPHAKLTGIALLILTLAYSYLKLRKVFDLRDISKWFKKD